MREEEANARCALESLSHSLTLELLIDPREITRGGSPLIPEERRRNGLLPRGGAEWVGVILDRRGCTFARAVPVDFCVRYRVVSRIYRYVYEIALFGEINGSARFFNASRVPVQYGCRAL